jgi:hypothetical protein
MQMTSAAAALAVALALLGAASVGGASASGLRGVVIRSPITPVCVQGAPCSAPAKTTTIAFFRNDKTVTTRTDDRGRYRVALAPGWWNVGTSVEIRIGSRISPADVRVLAGRFRVVNFDIDTGIR